MNDTDLRQLRQRRISSYINRDTEFSITFPRKDRCNKVAVKVQRLNRSLQVCIFQH